MEAKNYFTKDELLRKFLYYDIDYTLEKYFSADILFICDITGSMDPYIDHIKETLKDFITSLELPFPPRIGFIGFKDKCDQDQLATKEFTLNIDEILMFIDGLECYGGGDTCEDVVTPLKHSLDLDWKSDSKTIYLLIQTPTHGKKYHHPDLGDDYLDDDKKQMLEKLMCHFKNNMVNFGVIRCDEENKDKATGAIKECDLDRMLKIMQDYYNSQKGSIKSIRLAQKWDLKCKGELKKIFAKSLSEAFSGSFYQNYKKIKARKVESDIEPLKKIDEPIVHKGVVYGGYLKGLDYGKGDMKYKISYDKGIELEFGMDIGPIGTGAFYNCYPLIFDPSGKLDKTKVPDYILKSSKVPKKSLSELKPEIEATLITNTLIKKFNKMLKEKILSKSQKVIEDPILACNLYIIELKGSNIGGSTFIYIQKYLSGDYVKFNNNNGWLNKEREDSLCFIAQAFSHFTYEYSKGAFIVVDIQGGVIDNTLSITDPAIHSVNIDRYGETNNGRLGIMKFFRTHICKEECKLLGLTDATEMKSGKLTGEELKLLESEKYKYLHKKYDEYYESLKVKLKGFKETDKPIIDDHSEDTEDITCTKYDMTPEETRGACEP